MSFRQLDVDRLDPDSVVNTVPNVEPSGLGLDDIAAVVANARASLTSGNRPAALKTLLEYPPYGSDQETKTAYAQGLIAILPSKAADIAAICSELDPLEQTTLMKVLYYAFSTKQGQANGGILLQVHEKLVEAAGQKVIVKHLSDRRTL